MTDPSKAKGLDYIAAVGVPEGFLDGLTDDQLAALRTEAIEVLEHRAGALPGSESIPIMLGGAATFRCSRCWRSFSATTWRVVDLQLKAGHVSDVCQRCAEADPELSVWAAHCGIADMIDAVMQAAADEETRRMLASCISGTADYFSVWRWPPDE